MKKFFKTIVLIPMWPLIWMQMNADTLDDSYGCGYNANKILQWWKS